MTYKLDDGTGTVEVKQWIDSDKINSMDTANGSQPRLVELAYARVWGRMKAFNNKRHVSAHVIRPIQDHNEIQYHLLESTAVHLHFTRGPPGNEAKAQMNGAHQQDGYGGQNNHAKSLSSGLSPGARRVYEVLKTSPQSNEGLHMQDIASRLAMVTADVGKAGDELLNQGIIYTTVDDHTWAILEEI